MRQDRPGPPLCSTASATASAQQTELQPRIYKMLSHSSSSPPFLQSPLRQKKKKKKKTPCLRATSEMFKRLQRGVQLPNTSPLLAQPGGTSAVTRAPCTGAREGERRGIKCLFVGDTVLQREETCCYSDIVTSVIRTLRNKNNKTHHNSWSAQRKREEGGRKRARRNVSSLSLPRFSTPAPVSTPQEPRV